MDKRRKKEKKRKKEEMEMHAWRRFGTVNAVFLLVIPGGYCVTPEPHMARQLNPGRLSLTVQAFLRRRNPVVFTPGSPGFSVPGSSCFLF